jgi:uncharacterized damage-inducible protein DinB
MEIQSLEVFLEYYGGIRGRTRRVIDCIPPDYLEWSHREGKFTFGDLIRHLAGAERYMFAENVAGRSSCYPGHGRELARRHDAVLEYFERLHVETMEILRALPPGRLQERCETPAGISMRVWKWLRAMVELEVHHRGQLYLMLGMLDVSTPPLYGLTSEEVRARSLERDA